MNVQVDGLNTLERSKSKRPGHRDHCFEDRIDTKSSRRPAAVFSIIVLELVLAVLGFASGITFLHDPSGSTHGMDTSMLAATPISSFTPVGLFFVACYGILPCLAIYGLWRLPRWRVTDVFNIWTGQKWAWTATVSIGVILIVWIGVEVALIGSPTGLPRFLQVAMALFGVILIALAMLPQVRRYARIGGRT